MAIRGYLLVLAAASLWGSVGPIARYAFSQGIEPLEIAFWRCVIPFVPFAWQALRGDSVAISPRDIPMVGAFGILCVATFYGVYQLAIQAGGAALACVLMYTAPAWVAVMAWLFLKERMTKAKISAVLLTLAGVAGVSGVFAPTTDAVVTPLAVFFGLMSGLTYAMYFIFGKRLQPQYSTPVLFFWALPLGAAILFPFIEFNPKTPMVWVAILAITVLSTYIAYSLYYAGLRYLEATRASVVATIEPLVAAVSAYIWWDESFTTAGYAGSALILAAVLIIVKGDKAVQAAPVPDPSQGMTETVRQPH